MWPDANGDWGTWTTFTPDPNATSDNSTGAAASGTGDVLTSTAAPAAGQDRWSGWFQNLVGNVASYAIQKDARASGLVPATSASGQPVYTAAGAQVYRPAGANNSGMLLLAAAGLGLVLLLKKG